MDRYAVLGQPVAHSLSPRIHAMFAAQTSARLSYEAIEVAPKDMSDTLARLFAEGYAGLNLTLPLKIDVLPLCESLSPAAEIAGSANTLLRGDVGWRGDNTDGSGLLQDLSRRLGLVIVGKRLLVLGAGGAARGILSPLLAEMPSELVIAGRTPWKAEEIAAGLKSWGLIRPCTFLALKGDQFDLVINATSAGHYGTALKLPPDLFAAGAAAYDLNYGPSAEPFLNWARSRGASHTSDGLGMLVEQAADAFALWRGTRPLTSDVLAAVR